jgi:Zn-dependent protease with chaperone function
MSTKPGATPAAKAAKPSLYPPNPAVMLATLAEPPKRFRRQAILVLCSLVLFLVVYFALLAGVAWSVYAALTPSRFVTHSGHGISVAPNVLQIGWAVIGTLLFLFLFKGLFKKTPDDKLHVEIDEEEHPALFAFIRRLARDTGAPEPYRVFVCPEVNAAVFYDTSLLSLLWPREKNLLIGLGLVNCLNLAEFKAVLAHEFGHFAQRSMQISHYVYVANRIISDIVMGQDAFDRMLDRWRRSQNGLAVIGMGVYGALWGIRKGLEGLFHVINFAGAELSRQMEFGADLVAVSVTGSDSLIHALSKIDFASDTLEQAVEDLHHAAEHKLFTSDLFYHQNRAVAYLRIKLRQPNAGEPPPLPPDPSLRTQVFHEGDDGIPPMYASHPTSYEREKNAKANYIRSPQDDRPAWVLFTNPAAVRGRLTARFNRLALKFKKSKHAQSPPDQVQEFIDAEHAETAYDPKYHGLYDRRYVEPGDVDSHNLEAASAPWPPEKITATFTEVYFGELKERMDKHHEQRAEYNLLVGLEQGELKGKGSSFTFRGKERTPADIPRLLAKVNKELEANYESFKQVDRDVFCVHCHMARQLSDAAGRELLYRYRFHAAVQAMLKNLKDVQGRAEAALCFLMERCQFTEGDIDRISGVFQKAHDGLVHVMQSAKQMDVPALANLPTDSKLAPLLLDKPLVSRFDAWHSEDGGIEGRWVGKFLDQIGAVIMKLKRIHLKSLGAILTLQEKIAAEWHQRRGIPLPTIKEADAALAAVLIEESEPRPKKRGPRHADRE